MFSAFIPGIPIPQGSKICVNNRPIESNKKIRVWRKQLADHLGACWNQPTLDVPVSIDLVFYFPKPAKPKFEVPAVKPDIDKLARAVLDAGTDAGLYVDDSRIINLNLSKRFVNEWHPDPGVQIRLTIDFVEMLPISTKIK